MIRRSLTGALLAMMLAGTALAGLPGERLFVTGQLEGVATGKTLVYAHERSGTGAPDKLHPITGGSVDLALTLATDGARAAVITLRQGTGHREFDPLPATAGNPILLTFLESSVNRMAAVSGGSPFYIRNRFKDAFRDGGTLADVTVDYAGARIAATEITFIPFANDPNRDRMGGLGTVTLRFVLSDAVPGGFVELTAATAADAAGTVMFRETMALTGLKPEN